MNNEWDYEGPGLPPEWDGEFYWDDESAPMLKGKHMKVKVGASRMTDAEVIAFVNNIIANGTGKPELADATPPLADMTTLAGECETAMEEESTALDTYNAKVSTREVKLAALRVALNSFAQSVDTLYGGDAASLQAIGLPLRGTPQPVGALPAPGNLRSYAGPDEECIRLRWNKVRGANHYELFHATNPAGPWTWVTSPVGTRTECLELTSGTEYYFRVRAVGAAGKGAWSDITRKRAL
jgi:hypothetical protein